MAMASEPIPSSFAPGELRTKILRKCRESMATKEQFFTDHADRIAECAAAMARAFDHGAHLSWATAAVPAMPPTSRSNSCTRSLKNGPLFPPWL